MARPIKPGLDYFNIDCVQNDDLNFIEARFGLEGFAIVLKLWQKIYRAEGYYMCWNERSQYLFSREINMPPEKIQAVIDCCMDPLTHIFDRSLYEQQQILTSEDIQNRWLKVIRECKRKGVCIKAQYCLLPRNEEAAAPVIESVPTINQSVESQANQSVKSINQSLQSPKVQSSNYQSSGIVPETSGVIPEDFPKISEETTQRKEKEIKENKSKEEGIGTALRPPLAGQTPSPAAAGSPKKSLEERKLLFRKKMDEVAAGRAPDGMPLLDSPVYTQTMLQKLFQYWTECNDNGRKMRFEMEKVFEMSRRLATWKTKEQEFSQRTANRNTLQYNSSPLRPSGYEPSRHRDGYGTL